MRAESLAALDRAKTTFFSNISHELRTPLTLILSPLEDLIAHEKDFPPERAKEIEVIYRNALRLLKLVNTLLDFSRMEADRVKAHFQPVNLETTTDGNRQCLSVCHREGWPCVSTSAARIWVRRFTVTRRCGKRSF